MKGSSSLSFMMVGFTSPTIPILAALGPQLVLATPLYSSRSSSPYTPSATTTSYREVFTIPPEADYGAILLPNIKDPHAVNVQDVCPGYTASGLTKTRYGFTASLDIAGPACNVYGNDIANLTLVVQYQAKDRVNVQITPKFIGAENETWFILPERIIPRPGVDDEGAASHNDLDVIWTNDPTFSFTVTRKATSDVLFTTKGSKLIYADQYIEFGSSLPENYNLYGLGEVIHSFRLGNILTRTLFAADAADPIDQNIYGVHPVYHDTRYFIKDSSSGNLTYVANATDASQDYVSYTHGVFNRNAHAQEILLRERNITWRGLGGNIDLFFFSGPDAETLIQSYQRTTVGYPAMQQYWTLGYHQCRWGYQNWTVLQDVVDNFKKFNIPLETIWTDIDYMNQYRNWENDQRTFGYKEGTEFLSNLHRNHQHYVPIVDSAIYAPNPENASDTYPTYDRGAEADAFLLDADGDTYIGSVWPGYTVFPDWVGAVLNISRTFEWWSNEMVEYHKIIDYDGIWIDMSEVSSFCVGPCGKHNLTLNPVHPPFSLPGEEGELVLDYPEAFNVTNATEWTSVLSVSSTQANPPPTGTVSSSTSSVSSTPSTSYLRTSPPPGSRNVNYPPYTINNVQGDLAVHAVSPNATHHGNALEYDFHNLNGHLILNATYHGLLAVYNSTRPFIIGRSTFAGSGKWAGHWGGDNASKCKSKRFGRKR
jgi:alpha-glucosidase